MKQYPKKFSLLRANKTIWVMSEYTGEIARPYEIGKILCMILDFFRY